ncbi:hypothetical protein FKM82_014783 [Ascaphus truei]
MYLGDMIAVALTVLLGLAMTDAFILDNSWEQAQEHGEFQEGNDPALLQGMNNIFDWGQSLADFKGNSFLKSTKNVRDPFNGEMERFLKSSLSKIQNCSADEDCSFNIECLRANKSKICVIIVYEEEQKEENESEYERNGYSLISFDLDQELDFNPDLDLELQQNVMEEQDFDPHRFWAN